MPFVWIRFLGLLDEHDSNTLHCTIVPLYREPLHQKPQNINLNRIP